MEKIHERLKILRQKLGLTQKEFGEKIGKSWITINRWEAGDRPIPEPILYQIALTFGVSYEWLKTGQGEIFEKKPSIEEIILAEQRRIKENMVLLPLIGRVGAGYPQDRGDVEILAYLEIPKIPRENPKNLFAVKVVGDSMYPTLQEDDIVIAKHFIGHASEIKNKKIVIVANEWGELYIKRLIKTKNEFLLTSDNPAYPPIQPNDYYRIIGIAIQLIRRIPL